MNAHPADSRAERLVRLAQQQLTGDSPLSDDAGFARLQARLTVEQPRGRRWLLAGAALLAASGAVSASFLLQPRARALTFEVAGGRLGEDGRILAREGTRVAFSDGSLARLSSGTEASIQNVTEHGAEVVLARGSMHVQIAKKPRAEWKVAAGPYDVRVTGTAFDVSWSAQSQAFDLRMVTGSVIVTGPLAQGGIPLKAGQHMFGGVAEGRLTVEGGEVASAVTPDISPAGPISEGSAPEVLPPSVSSPEPSPAPVPSGPPARPPGDAVAWKRQVAEGHFEAVIEQAERRGLERILSSGSLEELSALADAARYSGRSSVAKRVLVAERQRFAGSSAARDAAFFLGRIAEDSGAGGLDWYERYLSESPRGAYVSQAFGRRMMLLYKQRGAAAAKPAAADYLSRYPNGPYAAAARKLIQESPATRAP